MHARIPTSLSPVANKQQSVYSGLTFELLASLLNKPSTERSHYNTNDHIFRPT